MKMSVSTNKTIYRWFMLSCYTETTVVTFSHMQGLGMWVEVGTCISEPPPSMLLASQVSFCDWSRALEALENVPGASCPGLPSPNSKPPFPFPERCRGDGGRGRASSRVVHILLLGCAFLVTETSCDFPWTVTPAVVGTVVDNITARVSAFIS